MDPLNDALRGWRARTEPTPREVDALVASVERPLRRSRVAPALMLVAAALLAWLAWPTGSPESVRVELRSDGPELVSPDTRWSVVHQGEGELTHRGDDVRLDWRRGRLEVDVAPGAGVRLVVVTPEGEVRVVGTRFAVERDASGTKVAVERGKVEVHCDSSVTPLEAGASQRCWASTAAARLEQARGLRQSGSALDAVLEVVDRGLATQPSVAVRSELVALAVDALYEAGRDDEVLRRGLSELDEGPRRLEIAERVAAAQVRLGGCALAAPLLEWLAEERGSPVDLERAARCR